MLCSRMIIATRILRVAGDDGDVEVPVHIHMPVEDDRAWRCDYEIGWPEEPRRYRAFGFDGVQALQLVMLSISVDLRISSYHRSGTLRVEDNEPGYGFPTEVQRED